MEPRAANERVRGWLSSRALRVLVMGAAGLGVQTVIFEIIGIHYHFFLPSTAAIIAGEIGLLSNFFLNNRFSFKDRQHATIPFWSRLLRFHLVVSVSLFLQWLFLFETQQVTSSLLLLHAAYIAGVVVGFISNYAGYYFWVWKQQPKSEDA